jgi:hypothetical protein
VCSRAHFGCGHSGELGRMQLRSTFEQCSMRVHQTSETAEARGCGGETTHSKSLKAATKHAERSENQYYRKEQDKTTKVEENWCMADVRLVRYS